LVALHFSGRAAAEWRAAAEAAEPPLVSSLGLELPGLGLDLGFHDKVSVSVSSRNLSQVSISVSEVTVWNTSLRTRFPDRDPTGFCNSEPDPGWTGF